MCSKSMGFTRCGTMRVNPLIIKAMYKLCVESQWGLQGLVL